MDRITSRQNPLVKRFLALESDGKQRQQDREYVCAGQTLLKEAIASGSEITCVLSQEEIPGLPVHLASREVVQAASPLLHAPGPVFTVRMRNMLPEHPPQRIIVLENVQDPGNVGTVLRTADGMGIDLVLFCGACADPYNPKAVRASMGAVFRQCQSRTSLAELPGLLGGIPLYGAAHREGGLDVRCLPAPPLAVAVGNEGSGLTDTLLALCADTVSIPMRPPAESYNAALAAALCMWEMVR